MPKRTYGQMCSIARALDAVGERWSLLIVRELLLGPKRFKDLLTVLPAMGTNRLGERLKQLEADGVVAKQTLPPPAGVPVYVLTELGERLRPVITHLALFGMDLPLDERIDRDTARAELIALLRADLSRPAASTGVHEAYQFQVGHEVFHVVADDGVVRARSGPSPTPPAVSASCDFETFFGLVSGRLSASRAVKEGRVEIEGPVPALTRATRVLVP